ncbi:MAG TPA: STAS domain-containing protein [Terriglobales bacterium]|nr:STAS domain-containing protein [Terriglobales bacterium]
METSRPVVVKHMPERVNVKQARVFLRDVEPLITSDRPQIVFDLSSVKQLDAAGVDMLLQCMSEVMKRDGDLKLAALSPHAAVILELTRTDRLFEIYETTADAVRSFSHFIPAAMRHQPFGLSSSGSSTAGSAQPTGVGPRHGGVPDVAA